MLALRLLPVILVTIALSLWMFDVQGSGGFALSNILPPTILLVLSAVTLVRGKGTWSGAGRQLPFATLGFAIPAVGLTAYLHYAYSINMNGMFTDADQPLRVFRYLPLYTTIAGVIGFAIGWIAGRES